MKNFLQTILIVFMIFFGNMSTVAAEGEMPVPIYNDSDLTFFEALGATLNREDVELLGGQHEFVDGKRVAMYYFGNSEANRVLFVYERFGKKISNAILNSPKLAGVETMNRITRCILLAMGLTDSECSELMSGSASSAVENNLRGSASVWCSQANCYIKRTVVLDKDGLTYFIDAYQEIAD